MTRRHCPLCGEDRPRLLATVAARTICDGNTTYRPDAPSLLGIDTAAEFAFVRCLACGFVYAQDAPGAALLERLYNVVIDAERAYAESHQPSWVAHQLQLAATLLARFENRETANILDYGCGHGAIVRALACTGYEYAESVAAAGRARGLAIFSDMNEIRARAPFDGIVLSDVLEHVPEPRATLATCRDLLHAGGWICVSVPDFSERRARAVFDALRRGEAVTREVNPWEHLNYFSPETLAAMLTRGGFVVEPYATATFGLRPAGWGNALKSAGRMLGFAARPHATTTTLLARRD
ncbi:MAG: class I SAM-dependent methyltransferase [Acidobacteria bacterium]|nr:class I SAM-dependent methyltransferase [Acidobacteriota bacterium]MBV9476619.1 class I SAM-dependent methyltransferase [Acidobacteriota bacterium]